MVPVGVPVSDGEADGEAGEIVAVSEAVGVTLRDGEGERDGEGLRLSLGREGEAVRV